MATNPPRPPLTGQDEGFVFASLMLVTCFFLPWSNTQSPSDLLSGGQSTFWRFLLVVLGLTPLTVRLPRVRPWMGLFAVLCLQGALMVLGGTEYGAQLARFFALAMLILSAQPAVIGATDFALRRLNAQKVEVSSHWGTALRDLHFSAHDFYTKIEAAIVARCWPGVELLRVQHREAGLLSHEREYLRVIRQRQVFDVCAATFGKDYFFSLREAEIKPPLSFVTLLIFLLSLALLLTWSMTRLGLVSGLTIFSVLCVLGLFLLWNVLRMGLTRLDGLLMRAPVIGPIYEIFFRRSTTYFQHDTRMVFLKLMDELVKEQVDEEASAQGIKLLSCFEYPPLFAGFYTITERPTDGTK